MNMHILVGTHWTALFCTEIEVIYFDSFGVEHVSEEIETFIEHKNKKQTYLESNQIIQ